MSEFDDVGRFHKKFNLPEVYSTRFGPKEVTPELMDFRIKFLQEELDEFKEGNDETDHAKMFDALIDLVYVALGTAHLLGYPWIYGWEAVQDANMAKVRAKADGSNSARGSSYDVVKPEGWVPPDIIGVLQDFGWQI